VNVSEGELARGRRKKGKGDDRRGIKLYMRV
jgi:hypothetical protein